MRYLRVFETHKDGTLHVHMLADYAPPDIRVEQRYNKKHGKVTDVYVSVALSEVLSDMGLGWVHDVRPLVQKRDMSVEVSIGAYLGKYLTKQAQSAARLALADAGLGKIRMLQTSHGWSKMEAEHSDIIWSLGGSVSMSLVMLLREKGIFYYDLNRREFLDEFHAQAGSWPNKSFEILMNQADDQAD
jgi:hypothetical protein